MDFSLSAEDQRLVDRAKALAKEFLESAKEYDDESAFPDRHFERLREEGFLTLGVPRELGGHGMWHGENFATYYLILESLAAGYASTGQLVQIQSHATGIIGNLGNDEQKRRILKRVVDDGALIASCGSETNPQQLRTQAATRSELEPVDGGFRLNSVKHFASLAPAADYYVVYALAPGASSPAEGVTVVVVSKDDPGVSLEDNWDVMGMRSTISWALKLEDVFVPWENVLGEPGDWIQHDPRTFTLAYVANHLGTAQGVYDFVIDYLKERSFLMNDDVNVFNMGDMAASLQATRTSMLYAAWLWEQGKHEEAEMASMRALHTSKQAALLVTTKAFDVCGARAAFRHLPVERAYRDVRTFSLHFRESQLMRILIEAELGGEFFSKQRYGPKLGRQSWKKFGIDVPVPA